jgi:hypothetical protein
MMTTMMLGEEGGDTPITTAPSAEEQTTAVGRRAEVLHVVPIWEMGRAAATTDRLGEEHPPFTTAPRFEEIHTDFDAESTFDPGTTTTAPLMEETTQMAGEGQQGPHITTMLQGEEQGGGGTVFTTLVVGEEGGTTAPWFEEMMPGPVIGPGGTSPTTDDPKAPAGEGWFDPQNFNPLGRR